MKTLLGRLVREEEAQDLIEYALLAALIALAAVVVLGTLGTAIFDKFTKVEEKLTTP
jgi:pilus assembly protein Flp/PilA